MARVTTVDKFAFPADSRSTLGTGLSFVLSRSSGMANSGVAGYIAGGDGGGGIGQTTTVHKFAFPTDSRSTLATGIQNAAEDSSAFSNQAVAGYVAGGYGAGVFSTVNKFAFPADTRTILATGLSGNRGRMGGMANSGTAGYFGGGAATLGGTRLTTVDKFAFPSDTRSTLGTGLSVAKNTSGFADTAVAGYFPGGELASGLTTGVDKFAFPADTRSTLGTGLSTANNFGSSMANEGIF